MATQKRGEGRVVIGLPERLEKAKIALTEAQSKLTQIQLIVEARPIIGDEAALVEIDNILRGVDD